MKKINIISEKEKRIKRKVITKFFLTPPKFFCLTGEKKRLGEFVRF